MRGWIKNGSKRQDEFRLDLMNNEKNHTGSSAGKKYEGGKRYFNGVILAYVNKCKVGDTRERQLNHELQGS